jgi:hypothetical protein
MTRGYGRNTLRTLRGRLVCGRTLIQSVETRSVEGKTAQYWLIPKEPMWLYAQRQFKCVHGWWVGEVRLI